MSNLSDKDEPWIADWPAEEVDMLAKLLNPKSKLVAGGEVATSPLVMLLMRLVAVLFGATLFSATPDRGLGVVGAVAARGLGKYRSGRIVGE